MLTVLRAKQGSGRNWRALVWTSVVLLLLCFAQASEASDAHLTAVSKRQVPIRNDGFGNMPSAQSESTSSSTSTPSSSSTASSPPSTSTASQPDSGTALRPLSIASAPLIAAYLLSL